MHISQALMLRVGQPVSYPLENGQGAGKNTSRGTIEHISPVVETSYQGLEYIHVTVRRPFGHASVWPSTRLGL